MTQVRKRLGLIHVSHVMNWAIRLSCIPSRMEKLLAWANDPLKPNTFRNAQHMLPMFRWLRLDLDCLYADRAFKWASCCLSDDSHRDSSSWGQVNI